jgi:hypothetical protein
LIHNLHQARLNLKAYKESLIWTIILSHQFSIPVFRICSSSAYKPREAVQHSNYKIRETKIKCSGSTRKQIRITPQSHKALVPHNRRTLRKCDLPDMAVIRNPEEVIATHL